MFAFGPVEEFAIDQGNSVRRTDENAGQLKEPAPIGLTKLFEILVRTLRTETQIARQLHRASHQAKPGMNVAAPSPEHRCKDVSSAITINVSGVIGEERQIPRHLFGRHDGERSDLPIEVS